MLGVELACWSDLDQKQASFSHVIANIHQFSGSFHAFNPPKRKVSLSNLLGNDCETYFLATERVFNIKSYQFVLFFIQILYQNLSGYCTPAHSLPVGPTPAKDGPNPDTGFPTTPTALGLRRVVHDWRHPLPRYVLCTIDRLMALLTCLRHFCNSVCGNQSIEVSYSDIKLLCEVILYLRHKPKYRDYR